MKERIKDLIIGLSGVGAGMLVLLFLTVLGADSGAADLAGVAVGGLAVYKIHGELSRAIDLRCDKCGRNNPNESNFCARCGAPLGEIKRAPFQPPKTYPPALEPTTKRPVPQLVAEQGARAP